MVRNFRQHVRPRSELSGKQASITSALTTSVSYVSTVRAALATLLVGRDWEQPCNFHAWRHQPLPVVCRGNDLPGSSRNVEAITSDSFDTKLYTDATERLPAIWDAHTVCLQQQRKKCMKSNVWKHYRKLWKSQPMRRMYWRNTTHCFP
jgi:hypothetical protein